MVSVTGLQDSVLVTLNSMDPTVLYNTLLVPTTVQTTEFVTDWPEFALVTWITSETIVPNNI